MTSSKPTKVGSFHSQEKRKKMAQTKLKQDIERLKEIHQELEEHYFDDEWDLCDFHKDELYRITGMEEHDWDENVLAHYIDGMQRAIHLKEVYDE